jgi:hypothetical protein
MLRPSVRLEEAPGVRRLARGDRFRRVIDTTHLRRGEGGRGGLTHGYGFSPQ